MSRTGTLVALFVILLSVLAPLAGLVPSAFADATATPTPLPKFHLHDPCALDPHNLVQNGSMAPGHNTPYGTAAANWEPVIYSGAAPQFNWVGNEQIDPNGAQQMFSVNPFDAGIRQTVSSLQPGMVYMFRLGYSLAAKSINGPNVRVQTIGRQVGVDPFGGTDPQSPRVIWGPDFFEGKAAVNIPAMVMIFTAQANQATLFLRAKARDGSGGENRVWFDAVCMEARPEIAPASVQVPAQARAQAPAAAVAAPTKTRTPTRAASATPTNKPAATLTATPAPTNTPTAPAIAAAAALPPTETPTATIAAAAIAPPAQAQVAGEPISSRGPVPPGETDNPIVQALSLILLTGSLALFGNAFFTWRRTERGLAPPLRLQPLLVNPFQSTRNLGVWTAAVFALGLVPAFAFHLQAGGPPSTSPVASVAEVTRVAGLAAQKQAVVTRTVAAAPSIAAADVSSAKSQPPAPATAAPAAAPATAATAPTNTPVPVAVPATATPTRGQAAAAAPAATRTRTPASAPAASSSYATLPVLSAPANPPPPSNPDLDLARRGYARAQAPLQLMDYEGGGDASAPNLSDLIAGKRNPKVQGVYQVYNWDAGCNCKGALDTDWDVTLLGLAVTPGTAIQVPGTGRDIGKGYQALVLYADSERITLKYTRDDNVVNGYTVHIEGVAVDPALLKLYQDSNNAGRKNLPALRGAQVLGRAASNEIKVAIRDTGSLMDPRSRKDWWRP